MDLLTWKVMAPDDPAANAKEFSGTTDAPGDARAAVLPLVGVDVGGSVKDVGASAVGFSGVMVRPGSASTVTFTVRAVADALAMTSTAVVYRPALRLI
jgi:hypothetical protein